MSAISEYFGDPLRSMNTIFGIFTVENWGAVSEAAKALNQLYEYYAVNAFVITVFILGALFVSRLIKRLPQFFFPAIDAFLSR